MDACAPDLLAEACADEPVALVLTDAVVGDETLGLVLAEAVVLLPAGATFTVVGALTCGCVPPGNVGGATCATAGVAQTAATKAKTSTAGALVLHDMILRRIPRDLLREVRKGCTPHAEQTHAGSTVCVPDVCLGLRALGRAVPSF